MTEVNKLRWRCRRGTLELDRMLVRYLDNRYLAADVPEQQAFRSLLVLEDSELIHYLLGEKPAANPALRRVIARVRTWPEDRP